MAARAMQDAKWVPILSGLQTAAATDRTSEVIDTSGFSGLWIVVHFLTVHNSAVQTLFVQASNTATNETTLSSGADVLGSSQTIAGTDDNKTKGWDIWQPAYRYYQVTVNKDATNAGDEVGFAILYAAKVKPVVQALGTSTVGEGTATSTFVNLNRGTLGTA